MVMTKKDDWILIVKSVLFFIFILFLVGVYWIYDISEVGPAIFMVIGFLIMCRVIMNYNKKLGGHNEERW